MKIPEKETKITGVSLITQPVGEQVNHSIKVDSFTDHNHLKCIEITQGE